MSKQRVHQVERLDVDTFRWFPVPVHAGIDQPARFDTKEGAADFGRRWEEGHHQGEGWRVREVDLHVCDVHLDIEVDGCTAEAVQRLFLKSEEEEVDVCEAHTTYFLNDGRHYRPQTVKVYRR